MKEAGQPTYIVVASRDHQCRSHTGLRHYAVNPTTYGTSIGQSLSPKVIWYCYVAITITQGYIVLL